ncbi:MAG: hypothetical protein HY907_09170 [Deltaproteobacteria bacterium]|nr:hypothetical protein [Deltaproteobacteria bacterium]
MLTGRRFLPLLSAAALLAGCSLLYPFELPEEDAGDAADADTTGGDDGGETDVPPTCGNGTVDPGEACDTAIAPGACDPGCGSTGTERCVACTSLECDPPSENCNGADDDCDGETDEGYPCAAGSDVACTTPCGVTGVAECSATCEAPSRAACASTAEACNGCDDTRDGSTDEGCACRDGWAVEHPLAPGPESLFSIAAAPDGHAFAVGSGGVILHWDGARWTREVPPGAYNLRWVDALREDFAVAVGSNGSVVWRRGASWTYDDSSGTSQPLFGVSIVDENDVWASGANGTVIHWDGASWLPSATGTTRHLYRILATTDDVFAVGTGGTVLHFDGTSWTRISDASVTSEIETAWVVDADHLWVAGTDGFLASWERTTATWTVETLTTSETLYSLWGSSTNDIWAGGGWNGGILLHYDGTTWTEDRTAPSVDRKGYLALSGTAANDVYGSLHDGGIVHYDGTSWRPMEGAVTASLRAVWGVSGQDVFVAGATASPDGRPSTALLRYDGTRWTLASWQEGFKAEDVWAAARDDVYLVGGDQNIRRWDGASWTTSPVGLFIDIDLFGVWGVPGDEIFIVGGQDETITDGLPRAFHGTFGSWTPLLPPDLPDVDLLDVAGTNADDIMAVGSDGTILLRAGADGLAEIDSGTTETLRSVWVDVSGDAFAVGDNGIIVHWDGTGWLSMTTGSDPWYGFRLNAVWGASADNVFAAGESSTLLHWDGTDWTPVVVDALADLTDVWGTSANNVFVVANDRSGIILHRCGSAWSP